MKNLDSKSHVRGESVYLDDIPFVQGTLFACVFDSPVAHGKLKSINTENAEHSEGVVRIIAAADLAGENQIGGVIPDEPLLADKEVHFQGMPVAIVVATSEETPPKVVNLMDALRQSLDRVSTGKKKSAKAEIEKPVKAAPKKRAAR